MIELTDLYDEYESMLYRYALGLARDRDRADDLVQETFIRAMGHLELLGLLKPHQRRAWLYRTLKNLFLDDLSARQRQENLATRLAWQTERSDHLPAEVMALNPFDLVPEQYREVVEKRYILGMNSQQIAQELGIPAATVRSRLHLAMKTLRLQKTKLR
jgi:RNA polymerase sigma-70 factor (ECF subfamily)